MAKDKSNCVTARDWLEFCADQADWQAGDEPIVMISYAGEDLPYLDKLRKHLDVALSRVKSEGRPFSAWDYARFRSGTSLGAHFPTEVATQMWRCRAAIILMSPDYVNSKFCFEIELPFLLWRMHHYGMRLFLLRLNSTVVDGDPFDLPDFGFPAEQINLMHIVDDRNPALMDRFDGHSEKMLKELDSERPDKAEARLAAYARAICDLLTRDEERRLAPKSEPRISRDDKRPAEIATDTAHAQDRTQDRQADWTPHRVVVEQKPRSNPIGRIAAAVVVIAIVGAIAGYLYISGRQADIASARLACDQAAASPADTHIRSGIGVPYEKLDPQHLGSCERALELEPEDATIAFETARLLEKAGRQHEAFDRYLSAYSSGNGLSANNIGVMYRDSSAIFSGFKDQNGCATSDECDSRAVDWFVRAIDRGVEPARYNLGLMFEAKRGVAESVGPYACAKDKDPDCDRKAVDQFALGAAAGDADAELHLSWLYLQQRGVLDRTDDLACTSRPDCDKLGISWLKKSLAQNDPDARNYAEALYRSRPDLKPQ